MLKICLQNKKEFSLSLSLVWSSPDRFLAHVPLPSCLGRPNSVAAASPSPFPLLNHRRAPPIIPHLQQPPRAALGPQPRALPAPPLHSRSPCIRPPLWTRPTPSHYPAPISLIPSLLLLLVAS